MRLKTASERVAREYLKQANLWEIVKEKVRGVLPSPMELNKGFSRYIEQNTFVNPQTGNEVPFKSLPPEVQDKVRFDYAQSVAQRKQDDSKYQKEENLKGKVFEQEVKDHEFEDSDMRNTTFANVKVVNTLFIRTNLIGSNFNNAKVFTNDFDESNLARSNFEGAKIGNVAYDKSNLSGASFSGSSMSQVDFDSNSMSGASFNGAKIKQIAFRKNSMVQSDFSDVVFGKGVTFEGCDLKGANFSGVTIPDAKTQREFVFKNCDLTGVDFSNIKGKLHQGLFVNCKGLYPNKNLQAFDIY
jgi:uncharacterized protein YjbI with pentapeptide repeats